jgi:biopolymer transport protein ExbB
VDTVKHIIVANGPLFTITFIVLSLSAVTLIIWRMWLNRNATTNLEEFVAKFQQTLKTGSKNAALEMCADEPGIVPKLFTTAVNTCREGKVATRNAIANLIELEILPDLNFLLPWIVTVIKLAPMAGLLGTVWGMILAFGKISGATKVNPGDLANDIGMALYTTAEGLLIAIPLIAVYTLLRERVGRFELEMQRATQVAMNLLQQMTGLK